MISSKFNLLTIGIVVEDKKINSDIIKVYPIELLPMFSGELDATDSNIESVGENDSGDLYSVNIEVSNYIEASWLNESSNRISSPDIVKGEQVLIYSYADSDDYYWISMGRDKRLRKLETVTYAFSDTPDNGGDYEKNRSNQYLMEISTHGKHVTLTTCSNDGEEFKYLLQLNTKDSCFILKDDAGNIIYLDSKNTEIRMENKEKSYVSLDKESIFIRAPENIYIAADVDINITAGNNINVEVGNDIDVSVGSNVNIDTGGSYSLSTGGSYSIDSSASVSINSSATATVAAPTISLSGLVSMGTVGRALSSSATVYGDMDVTGSINVTNTLTAKEVNATEMTASKFTGDFYGTLYGNTVP